MRNLKMTAFTNLNKVKLVFAFKATFVALLMLSVAFYFLPLTGKPSLPLLVAFQLAFSFCIAVMGVAIIYFKGYFYFSRQEALFATANVKAFLHKYNFETNLINSEIKWELTQRIRTAEINGYPVAILKRYGKWSSLIVLFALHLEGKKKHDILELYPAFSKNNIEVNGNILLMTVDPAKSLEEQIIPFINGLQENKISPYIEK